MGSDEFDEHMKTTVAIGLAVGSVSIICEIAAIFGAVFYNIIPVLINACWLLVAYIIGVASVVSACNDWENKDYTDGIYYYDYTCELRIESFFIAFAIVCLWIYPHIGFIKEVKQGILTRETYEREKFSCCCV